MFTGITQGCFPVSQVTQEVDLLYYSILFPPQLIEGLYVGASVSIDGVCQTVMKIENTQVYFQAIPETLQKTTLSELSVDKQVSIERSARWGDEVGGHELAGHVLETATLVARDQTQQTLNLVIQCSPYCMQFLYEKGFVALDGSSLTVGVIYREQSQFTVHLIPETLKRTQLGNKPIGARFNLEIDPRTLLIGSLLHVQFSELEAKLIKLIKPLSKPRD